MLAGGGPGRDLRSFSLGWGSERWVAVADGRLVYSVRPQETDVSMQTTERTPVRTVVGREVFLVGDMSDRVSVVDLSDGRQLAELNPGLPAGVRPMRQALAASSRSDLISFGMPDGVVLMDLGSGAVRRRACQVAGGGATARAWAVEFGLDLSGLCDSE
ncbi:hypothetical protein CATMQ487_44750 [Sphaerotilus microaerophilus]|uniref:Lipoprotein LpqB beta-propeller domain-containing protein n=1 Tax=Sphaerotilus microaerophilus TaxID=2914710 RepID=A0ABM7YSD5_9BURK|nr:hypothetical protein CATMQ487_44750 [Sphaerotilus sp. FB-5]